MSVLSFNPTSQRLGEIAVSQTWLTASQLNQAVSEQQRTNEKLGAVMVRLGHLTQMELDYILAQQSGNTITGDADDVRQRLGDILRKSGKLTQRQLNDAMQEQAKTNEKLGEVLVRLGLLSAEELDGVLTLQGDFAKSDPLVVRTLLGEILVASKRVSRRQLEEALNQHRLTKKQVGQILLESGHVSKWDIRNALKIQAKMLAVGIAAFAAISSTGCGVTVPGGQSMQGTKLAYGAKGPAQVRVVQNTGGARMNQQFNAQTSGVKEAQLPGGRILQAFPDGSRVVKDVPFIQQGGDNTCAQAVTTELLNYWGVKQDYQKLVDEQNKLNIGTHFDKIVQFMKNKGLQAKAYRQGNVGYIKSLVDAGKPPIVMLEFNRSLLQQHYVVVVGYNQAKGTIIFHDTIDGPYRELDEATFSEMWLSNQLANVPVLGGENYRGLIIEASK